MNENLKCLIDALIIMISACVPMLVFAFHPFGILGNAVAFLASALFFAAFTTHVLFEDESSSKRR